ncbi:hypothetical protein FGO68_gene8199 [Halteria grandinella]|uniref:Uncharacterized protein n=1 Tax=Halteria grandinella TaxID=5974 RepID=A0A8J8P1V5_HALGN|nr:hypothetical protein FGO68_gene8199 [Halteria grandinella]
MLSHTYMVFSSVTLNSFLVLYSSIVQQVLLAHLIFLHHSSCSSISENSTSSSQLWHLTLIISRNFCNTWELWRARRIPGHWKGQFFFQREMHLLQKSLRQFSHSIGSQRISKQIPQVKESLSSVCMIPSSILSKSNPPGLQVVAFEAQTMIELQFIFRILQIYSKY